MSNKKSISSLKSGQNLKRRLIKEKILPYICEICNQLPTWHEKPLVLQLDHKDGNRTNNEISNLRFLCPNCHTQTSTFCGKNITKNKENKIVWLCQYCNQPCSIHKSRCQICTNRLNAKLFPKKSKTNYPSNDILKHLICTTSISKVAISLGVSYNAVLKYCKRRGIV